MGSFAGRAAGAGVQDGDAGDLQCDEESPQRHATVLFWDVPPWAGRAGAVCSPARSWMALEWQGEFGGCGTSRGSRLLRLDKPGGCVGMMAGGLVACRLPHPHPVQDGGNRDEHRMSKRAASVPGSGMRTKCWEQEPGSIWGRGKWSWNTHGGAQAFPHPRRMDNRWARAQRKGGRAEPEVPGAREVQRVRLVLEGPCLASQPPVPWPSSPAGTGGRLPPQPKCCPTTP